MTDAERFQKTAQLQNCLIDTKHVSSSFYMPHCINSNDKQIQSLKRDGISRYGIPALPWPRGGSRILQGWVSNPSQRGTGGWAPKAPRGRYKFLYFLYQNGEYSCIPGDICWHFSFQKGHPNQKGGCPDTLETPWIHPCGRLERHFFSEIVSYTKRYVTYNIRSVIDTPTFQALNRPSKCTFQCPVSKLVSKTDPHHDLHVKRSRMHTPTIGDS